MADHNRDRISKTIIETWRKEKKWLKEIINDEADTEEFNKKFEEEFEKELYKISYTVLKKENLYVKVKCHKCGSINEHGLAKEFRMCNGKMCDGYYLDISRNN